MDAPISYHWPKLLLWSAVEGLLAATTTLQVHSGRSAVKAAQQSGLDCSAASYRLHASRALNAVQGTLLGLLVLYLFGVIYHLAKAFAELRKRSYKRYRIANTLVRVQVHSHLARTASSGGYRWVSANPMAHVPMLRRGDCCAGSVKRSSDGLLRPVHCCIHLCAVWIHHQVRVCAACCGQTQQRCVDVDLTWLMWCAQLPSELARCAAMSNVGHNARLSHKPGLTSMCS